MILPALVTLATLALEEVQVTVLLTVVLVGFKVTVRVLLAPLFRVRVLLLMATLFKATLLVVVAAWAGVATTKLIITASTRIIIIFKVFFMAFLLFFPFGWFLLFRVVFPVFCSCGLILRKQRL